MSAEFVTISASSYDPAALAAKLSEKSAEGWSVVGIVPTGGDITAFLSREAVAGSAAEEAPAAAAVVEAAPEPGHVRRVLLRDLCARVLARHGAVEPQRERERPRLPTELERERAQDGD
ncbi:MAG TPA: hypothetical protein PLS72_16845, partial [Ilumatobacteraceae bacterium]|nr:hypothetical protein [Ilumatobacteraceae bacterium]